MGFVLLLGGARSGKSALAYRLASGSATARREKAMAHERAVQYFKHH